MKVLLTKEYDDKHITDSFSSDYTVNCLSFIEIQTISSEFEITADEAIVTSRNSVKALSRNAAYKHFWIVGEQTAQALKTYTQAPMTVADNAKTLLQLIRDHATCQAFDFWCGASRLDFLPDQLQKRGIKVNEKINYQTIAKPQILEDVYDVYAFFSPSGVESFFGQNTIPLQAKLIAIGETTANALRQHIQMPIFTAEKPNLASIADCIKNIAYAEE